MLGEGDERKVIDAVHVDNVHEGDRHVLYRIDPMKYYEVEKLAEEKGLRVVGVYHSHPDHPARPSQYDTENSLPWYSYLIVSVGPSGIVGYDSWRMPETGETHGLVREGVSVTD